MKKKLLDLTFPFITAKILIETRLFMKDTI